MKRLLCLLLVFVLLAGCSASDASMDSAMALRQKLLSAAGCSFEAAVTADYGDALYEFRMDCEADSDGNLTFEVLEPESISGITGRISASGGQLTFDDQAVAFDLMADGQVSPVSAPWLLVKTLRGGYLTACAPSEDDLILSIDDSYEEDALHLEIRLDSGNVPVSCEIFWQGRRFLTIRVEDFSFL